MSPSIERLDHVALLASDAQASAAFYCEWADMEVIHERSDGAEVRWCGTKTIRTATSSNFSCEQLKA
jgi:catechol 2,3-dioxygenase-like lactoylglutathione lyase family enzyme